MPKRSNFTPVKTPEGWRINIPAKYSFSGKRERHFYRSRALALEAATALREARERFGDARISIAPTLAEMAISAQELLEPYGLTILQAAQQVVESISKSARSKDIGQALEEYLEVKDGRSASQKRLYTYMQRDLLEDFPGRTLASITGEELLAHLKKRTRGPSGHNMRRTLLSGFWRWASRLPREWCSMRQIEHLERKETSHSGIETLTADQCQKLLRTAESHYPETVPAYVLAMFLGIRREEITRLEPSDIRHDGVSVPAASSKTGRRRFINMTPTVRAWLDAYPVAETVCPSSWDDKDCAIRQLAGWRVVSRLIPEPPDPDLPAWPKNGLRHTAATVAVATGKPIETLVFEHGHSGGLQVLRNHYVGQMARAEALKILAIGPHGSVIPYSPEG